MDKGGGRVRKIDRDQVGRKRETDESLGEKTRGRGKGRWRWEERRHEQMMARGREGKQIGQEEERKEQWKRRKAYIW